MTVKITSEHLQNIIGSLLSFEKKTPFVLKFMFVIICKRVTALKRNTI